ncbi:MAG: nucleotidyltransferase domain-containing protein [Alphaproteobacteria bacterium]
MNIQEQIAPAQKVIRQLRRFSQIDRIYLFGSRARGDAQPRSDIDLAIACPQADSRGWADICEAVDEADTLLKIDVIRLEDAAPDFLRRILAEGRLLYERA